MKLFRKFNKVWRGIARPIRDKRERTQIIQAIEVKFQQGAIRQANRSNADPDGVEFDVLSFFGVAVYEMLKSADVSEVRQLNNHQLHTIDMIRCAYFDDAATFNAKLASIGGSMREALLEARSQAMAATAAV